MSENSASQILSNAIENGRLHHAIMLYGNSVKVLERVAKKAAAQYLGTHVANNPDVFELRPEGKMRQIKVGSEADKVGGAWPNNTMRNLLHNLRQTSWSGKKVAFVYEADRLNDVAANAFLKTLEEPPKGTVIFMLTSRPNDILATIRSRCVALRVECPPEPVDDEEWLKWIADFKSWQKSLMEGVGKAVNVGGAIMGCYGLLARFDAIITRLTSGSIETDEDDEDNPESEALDPEVVEAMLASERKSLRKRMMADIEDACVACALGGNGVKAGRISLSCAALERASGLMELNMPDTSALEFFMLETMRIWSR